MVKSRRGPDGRIVRMAELQLEKLLLHYAHACQAEGKSPSTVSWYQERGSRLVRFLEATGGRPVLSSLSLEKVREFIVHEQGRGLSPFTVQAEAKALKAFSTWLFNERYTKENRLARLKPPKVPVKVIEPLTSDELEKLLQARNPLTSIGSRDQAILLTFLATGIRRSELAGIRSEDAHVDEGYLKVMGKGSKERVVPLGAVAQRAIWRYVLHFRPEPLTALDDHLFLTLSGRALDTNAVRLVLARWGKAAGVPRLHAHLCRHTYATNFLVYECGDVFKLKHILGHTKLDMVARYVHFAESSALLHGRVSSPLDRINIKGLKGYKVDRALQNTKRRSSPGKGLL
jgi:site-specific recombinase XerD